MIGSAYASNGVSFAFQIPDRFNVGGGDELVWKTIGVAENYVRARTPEIALNCRRGASLGEGDFAGQQRGIDDRRAANEDQIDVETVLFEKPGFEGHP